MNPEIELKGVDWIHPANNIVHGRVLVNITMNLS
jgi:hypothetical protein